MKIEEIVADRVIANTMAWGHDYTGDQDKNIRVLIPSDFGIESRLAFKVNSRSGQQVVHVYDAENNNEMTRLDKREDVYFELKSREITNINKSGLAVINKLEEGALMIEYGIGGEEIARVLNGIENKANHMGLFDDMGIRKRPENIPTIVSQKYKVDETFKEKGTIFPLLGRDPEEVKEMFDNPEELIVTSDPYSGQEFGIAKKSDLDYFEKRQKIVNDVLIENGILMEELLVLLQKDEKMAMPIFMKIRQEVEERMTKDNIM